jgi:ABC-type transport system involved in multi-copper enzyme maturation permease subunit
MAEELRYWPLIWHSAQRLIFSIRGIIALLFSFYFIGIVAWMYNDLPPAFFELYTLFTSEPGLQFQWFFFDNALTKMVTIFVAPIFIFDAVSGDRDGERFGLMLSRPINRTQYMFMKLISAFLAFTVVFLITMVVGYPIFRNIVANLSLTSYFGTVFLIILLGFFAMCVTLLISTLMKKNLVSFIVTFGVMAFLMMPNAMKFTSPTFDNVAMATPHWYATYFTSHGMDTFLFIGFAVVIILFSLPFLWLSIWRFKKADL